MTHTHDTVSRAPLIPLILSGGTGMRLWPLSREAHPKPFLTLPDGQSLLQKTFLRALQLPNIHTMLTATNQAYYLKNKIAYEQVANTLPPCTFILEPHGRNTAPAIALATLVAEKIAGPEAILLAMPADHCIQNEAVFIHTMKQGIDCAKQNRIVVFGIQPTDPETGFGYIHYDPETHIVKRFIEKPTQAMAEQYLASGMFLWNSGLLCFQVSTMLQTLATQTPQLLENAKRCLQHSQTRANHTVIQLEETHFATLPAFSIDYAIMEKITHLTVIPCAFEWCDVGSFATYKKLFPTDAEGNTTIGDTLMLHSQHNFVHGDNRLIATIGVDHLAIIDTKDALLIAPIHRAQEVKHLAQTLKQRSHTTAFTHQTIYRPWGHYTVLEETATFKIKHITVNPQSALSLQKHHFRSEHWVVVQGTAQVINDQQAYTLQANESTFIPAQTPHRLSNTTDQPLMIIEVQVGSYVGEDDIVRLEDRYERIT